MEDIILKYPALPVAFIAIIITYYMAVLLLARIKSKKEFFLMFIPFYFWAKSLVDIYKSL